jgi:hypothetical protein
MWMRKTLRAALVTTSLALAVTAAAIGLAACGGPADTGAQAQARPSELPRPRGPMGDPNAMVRTLLDTLVTKDVITSSQADAVAAALGKAMEQLRPPATAASPGAQPTPGAQPSAGTRPLDPSTMFSSALDALVEFGAITSAQKTAIVDALSATMGAAPPGAQQPAGGSSTETY